MRALILDNSLHVAAKGQHTPACLLRLGDRPFLQHVIECLVRKGIREFDFALAESPRLAADYLGDGSRWGCKFHFHLISKAGIAPLVRSLSKNFEQRILIGRADRLPYFGAHGEPWPAAERALYFVRSGAQELLTYADWTGWALFDSREFLHHQMDAARHHPLGLEEGWLHLDPSIPRVVVEHEISVETPENVLSSQRKLLSGSFPDLPINGRQVDDGIWLGRNVSINPAAKLVAPVYIGSNSQVSAGALLGPYTVVAEDCIVGGESVISDALICPGTYVGENLHISESIVDRNLVTDVRVGAVYRVTDNFLLGSLSDELHAHPFRNVVDRLFAALLVVIFSPLFAARFLLYLTQAHVVEREEVMYIPEHSEEHAWKSFSLSRWRLAAGKRRSHVEHFWSVFLPGLISVVKGHLSLVGVQPRSAREVAKLPEDWRALYLQTKAGLITDAVVNFEPEPSEAEVHASECYYSATQSFTQDLRLMGSYLLKVSALPFASQPAEPARGPFEKRPADLRRHSSPETKSV